MKSTIWVIFFTSIFSARLNAQIEISKSKIVIENVDFIPDSVFNLSDIDSLCIEFCLIDSIPNHIKSMNGLKYLIIEGCIGLSNLDYIELPSTLNTVEICQVPISDIPSNIFKLENLGVLSITKTKIESIPPEISKLKNLKRLYLNNNNINEFQDEILKLELLEVLTLGNTKIKSFPNEIKDFKNLKRLWLPWNSFKGSKYLNRFLSEKGVLTN